MNIKSDFQPFIDGNGLLAPRPITPGTLRGSDNGTMFTSEYYIMLHRNEGLTDEDITRYAQLISSCIGTDHCLHRAPGDPSPDVIDNHIGVLAGYAEFDIAVNFHLVFPMWRYPQLVYAYLLARGVPSFLMFPFAIYNALVIGTSCIGSPISDTDSRRLNWLQWQATKRKSWIANLSGKFWHWRQTKIYGTPEVMKAVAAQYYLPSYSNPYATYWIDI